MADISELLNATAVPQQGAARGVPVPDHASQLLAQMLQAHVPDLLAATPGVKLLINDKPVVRGEEVYGSYDPSTKIAEINRPHNFNYIDKDRQPHRSAEAQLDTPTVIDYFNSAVHELQHGRSQLGRKSQTYNGADADSAIQKVFQAGVKPTQLTSLIDSVMKQSKNLASAQKASTPEILLEELLTYGAADKYSRDRFGANTPWTNSMKQDLDSLKIQHPWLTDIINSWTSGAKK